MTANSSKLTTQNVPDQNLNEQKLYFTAQKMVGKITFYSAINISTLNLLQNLYFTELKRLQFSPHDSKLI